MCPKCDTAGSPIAFDPRHSGWSGKTSRSDVMASGLYLNPKELDWYEKVVGQYLAAHEGGKALRFPPTMTGKRSTMK